MKTALTPLKLATLLAGLLISTLSQAHGVDEASKTFLSSQSGQAILPFIYIGAKHMVTGYDHLLFLTGVIFFLYRRREILLYVSLFTLGHSLTLLYGTLNEIRINPWLIDAIIGLSVVYKGFDNLGGFKRIFGYQPDTRIAVLIFGLFHGFGLATKLQQLINDGDGMIANLLAFNVGVELGQLAALLLILMLISQWRRLPGFSRFAFTTNTALISLGLMLTGYQLTGYYLS
ncbi:HupE/UreJ family protein [Marinobacterium sp. YM272]|uniref:HupE/UreJ family protein n=1 Tax=Marinobacterium sp. YM272 TaxID=3421654 RepID=UPI003D7F8CF6